MDFMEEKQHSLLTIPTSLLLSAAQRSLITDLSISVSNIKSSIILRSEPFVCHAIENMSYLKKALKILLAGKMCYYPEKIPILINGMRKVSKVLSDQPQIASLWSSVIVFSEAV